MELISNIEELNKKSGFRKSYIAEKLDVSVRQLRNYETGKSLIPFDKAYILCDLINADIRDLYTIKKDSLPKE